MHTLAGGFVVWLAPPGAGGDGRELPDDGGREIRWFRYVRHQDRAGFEAQGWVPAANLGPVHSRYGVLMELPKT